MADEVRKVVDEVREEIENAQEGAISDDEAEEVAGGTEREAEGGRAVRQTLQQPRSGVAGSNMGWNRR